MQMVPAPKTKYATPDNYRGTMFRYCRFLRVIFIFITISSCGLRHIDAPPLSEEDSWVKNGYKKFDIWKALQACGYDRNTWSMEQQIKVDECMLSRNFVFIDSPYGQQGSMCKFQSNENLPSCKSLRK